MNNEGEPTDLTFSIGSNLCIFVEVFYVFLPEVWNVFFALSVYFKELQLKVRLHTAINRADFASWWML